MGQKVVFKWIGSSVEGFSNLSIGLHKWPLIWPLHMAPVYLLLFNNYGPLPMPFGGFSVILIFLGIETSGPYLLTYMGVFGLWFSGVFANTVHLVQMICIPLESSDHGRCFYVPFIQTRASPGSSLVLHM